MHLPYNVLSVLALTAFALPSASLSPTPTKRTLSLNPTAQDLQAAGAASVPVPRYAAEPVTNAKRFAAGLPPLRPRHRQNGLARRAASSPLPPVQTTCNILVTSSGTELGFISPTWNPFGEYGPMQSGTDGALQVSFAYSASAPSELSVTAINSPSATYPFFGAIQGFSSSGSDLGPGSSNYMFIGGTVPAPAGATPTSGDNSFSGSTHINEAYETAIWTYDPVSASLTPQWINSDGGMPATYLVYVASEDAFALVGDLNSFDSTYGVEAPIVTFTCVPVQPATK